MTAPGGGPPTRDDLAPRRRARRGLVLPSGVLLLLAAFLPMVKVCDQPAYAIQYPFFWGPHVLGAIAMGLALCSFQRTYTILVGVARGVVIAQLGGFALVFLEGDGWPWSAMLAAAITGYWLATRRGQPELRAAHAVLAGGVLCFPWFALFVGDRDTLWGAYVALGASFGLILAGAAWRREFRRAQVDPMPAARVV